MGILVGSRKTKFTYDFLYRIYDIINPYIYTSEMRSELLKEVNGNRILDIGVGTGYTTKNLSSAVGIDLNKKMLLRAKGEYSGSLVLGDASKPPLKKNSFDTIISAGSLYYFSSPQDVLRLFHSLLKKNGVLLSITPSLRILKIFVHVFSKKDLQNLYSSAGFKVEKIENMRAIAYFCKARKI
jgi:ubiquinone/menaquinone biosynthesis C-methylase UbiE